VLIAIKLIHTVVWALLAGCILALPITGLRRRFDWTAILTAIILVEYGVLALNAGKCPLTDWAARFTNERAANFDIYLPNWLAQHNKAVFGTLFVVNELIVLWCLIGSTMKQVFKAGMLYFILVFAAGFVLGTIRTLWVVPRLGVRTAELIRTSRHHR